MAGDAADWYISPKAVDIFALVVFWSFSFLVAYRVHYHFYHGIRPLNARKVFHVLLWMYTLHRSGWCLFKVFKVDEYETSRYWEILDKLQLICSRFSLVWFFTALSYLLAHWLVVLSEFFIIVFLHWVVWFVANLIFWVVMSTLTLVMLIVPMNWDNRQDPLPYVLSMALVEVFFFLTIVYVICAATLLMMKLLTRHNIRKTQLLKFFVVLMLVFGVCTVCFAIRFVLFLVFPFLTSRHLPDILWKILGYVIPELIPCTLLLLFNRTRIRPSKNSQFIRQTQPLAKELETNASADTEIGHFLFDPLLDPVMKAQLSRQLVSGGNGIELEENHPEMFAGVSATLSSGRHHHHHRGGGEGGVCGVGEEEEEGDDFGASGGDASSSGVRRLLVLDDDEMNNNESTGLRAKAMQEASGLRSIFDIKPNVVSNVEVNVKAKNLRGGKNPFLVVMSAPQRGDGGQNDNNRRSVSMIDDPVARSLTTVQPDFHSEHRLQELAVAQSESLYPPRTLVVPEDPDVKYVELGRTELVEGDDPFFAVLLHYPHTFDLILFQLFEMIDLDDGELHKQSLVGQSLFETRYLLDLSLVNRDELSRMPTDGRSVSLTLPPSESTLEVSVVNLCLESNESAGCTSVGYFFPRAETRAAFHILEELCPSRFAYEVPYKYLCMTAPERNIEAHKALTQAKRYQDHVKALGAWDKKSSLALPRSGGGADSFQMMAESLKDETEAKVQLDFLFTLASKEEQLVNFCVAMCDVYRNCSGFIAPKTTTSTETKAPFRASTQRKNVLLAAVSVNLHVHRMVTEDCNYSLITCGAMAAHPFGFKENMGIRQLGGKISQVEKRLTTMGKSLPETERLRLVRRLTEMRYELRLRTYMCVPQALTAVITAFYDRLLHGVSEEFAEQLLGVGFLYQQESLLSTYGHERGMLGDMVAAITALNNVVIRVVCAEGGEEGKDGREFVNMSKAESGENSSYMIVVEMGISKEIFNRLPPSLRETSSPPQIVVWGVMFTQGINEKQTLSNTIGDSSLQDEINESQLRILQQYYRFHKAFYVNTLGMTNQGFEDTDRLLDLISAMIGKKKVEKNVELLQATADFCRMIGGARSTNCKSGKDRTAMSATMEEARILSQNHDLSPDSMLDVANIMRMAGVRRENVRRNVGKDKYAFTRVQLAMFPEMYRAPRGTTAPKTQT